jgi:hypothetical protein
VILSNISISVSSKITKILVRFYHINYCLGIDDNHGVKKTPAYFSAKVTQPCTPQEGKKDYGAMDENIEAVVVIFQYFQKRYLVGIFKEYLSLSLPLLVM